MTMGAVIAATGTVAGRVSHAYSYGVVTVLMVPRSIRTGKTRTEVMSDAPPAFTSVRGSDRAHLGGGLTTSTTPVTHAGDRGLVCKQPGIRLRVNVSTIRRARGPLAVTTTPRDGA
jgi:hypothetical protein